MSKARTASWAFTRRIRRGAFGWKSKPAIARVRQAVSEIKKVARRDPVLGAEGAVPFLERVSPALQVRGLGLFGEAIRLAVSHASSDPKTLTRAARDFAGVRPEFAVEAGLAALHWLAEGYGYEITGADVWAAYTNTMKAAEQAGRAGEARDRIRALVARETYGERFVTRILGQTLGL